MAEGVGTVQRPGDPFEIVRGLDRILDDQVLREPAGHRYDGADGIPFGPRFYKRAKPAIGNIDRAVEDSIDGGDTAVHRGPGDVEAFIRPEAERGCGGAGQIVDAEGRAGAGGKAD